MNPAVQPLLQEAEIHARVHAMADAIARTLPPDMFIVALLKGSFVFAADLVRALHRAGATPTIEFMTISSYGAGTESSGALTIHRDIAESVQGRHVLLIDDILESGRTLHHAHATLCERGATSVHIAVLLEKPGKCVTGVKAEFVGFTIPDQFVVGYGLDHAGHYRELPFIGVM